MGSDNTQGETKGLNAITPITVTHPERVDIDALRLFREPAWMLRLTIEGDRDKMWDLPKEEHPKEREPRRVNATCHRGPPHQGRERAWERARDERLGAEALHRCVDPDIAHKRDQREIGRGEVNPPHQSQRRESGEGQTIEERSTR